MQVNPFLIPLLSLSNLTKVLLIAKEPDRRCSGRMFHFTLRFHRLCLTTIFESLFSGELDLFRCLFEGVCDSEGLFECKLHPRGRNIQFIAATSSEFQCRGAPTLCFILYLLFSIDFAIIISDICPVACTPQNQRGPTTNIRIN